MPEFGHAWPFEPGAWSAAGRYWAEGRLEREGRGTSTIRHTDALWEIEGSMEIAGAPPLSFENRYTIAAPGEAMRILPWQSNHPAIGRLTGMFFVAGDTIMSSFQSRGGGLVGREHMTCLAPDRYRARGLFLRSDAIVSAWSMDLVRRA